VSSVHLYLGLGGGLVEKGRTERRVVARQDVFDLVDEGDGNVADESCGVLRCDLAEGLALFLVSRGPAGALALLQIKGGQSHYVCGATVHLGAVAHALAGTAEQERHTLDCLCIAAIAVRGGQPGGSGWGGVHGKAGKLGRWCLWHMCGWWVGGLFMFMSGPERPTWGVPLHP
jgi:hypothetical protein